ncbi:MULTISPECIES: tyrosine-type recombinase/integrase [Micromonospora]|uniref:tyrosine-type recombinase/integrase n=1 Tax=Micromonospora TaxID=1873 RepID=UPI00195863E6|nr:tyrosine-type recombinase/integrase [Micromonospora globbae]
MLVNLFREPIGAPMPPDAINALVAAACRRTVLRQLVTPHQMRHTFASNLVDAGGSIDELQELLGHASAGSSEVYLHPDHSRLRAAVDRVPTPREQAGAGMVSAVATVVGQRDRLDAGGRLRALLDPGFLAEAGWDDANLVLRPPVDHRLLGRPVCRAAGCGKTAHSASRICRGCTKARHGLTAADIAEAVDRLAALQFDRHGNRIWRQGKALLDSEHARRAVGEVVVPIGVCAEPSNVKAGGHSCPYRFRCVGRDHFRTDASYLPDLQAHLDGLLRNRERLRAATDVDDWARAEATPSDEEIARIRRLINRIKGDLDQLTVGERVEVEQAVAIVRRHRAVMLGSPRVRQALPDIRPERSA